MLKWLSYFPNPRICFLISLSHVYFFNNIALWITTSFWMCRHTVNLEDYYGVILCGVTVSVKSFIIYYPDVKIRHPFFSNHVLFSLELCVPCALVCSLFCYISQTFILFCHCTDFGRITMALTCGRRLILVSNTVIIQDSLRSDKLLTNCWSVNRNNLPLRCVWV